MIQRLVILLKRTKRAGIGTFLRRIQDGLMVLDRARIIVSVNQALEAIAGYKRKEVVGRPCSALNCDVCEIARDAQAEHWCRMISMSRWPGGFSF